MKVGYIHEPPLGNGQGLPIPRDQQSLVLDGSTPANDVIELYQTKEEPHHEG